MDMADTSSGHGTSAPSYRRAGTSRRVRPTVGRHRRRCHGHPSSPPRAPARRSRGRPRSWRRRNPASVFQVCSARRRFSRSYSSRSSGCVRSQSRNASIRAISSQSAENAWRLTFGSRPRNSRCSNHSGSRMANSKPAASSGRDVRRLVGRIGDAEDDVDLVLCRQARDRRGAGMFQDHRRVPDRRADPAQRRPRTAPARSGRSRPA